ncbi:hypothetical protein F5148DRAFT_182855 [Russula earlei]|uniref:Uncharacterized protein n=1 Tax=Russula earlei TaxID=71964 RepID=A0ACC0UL21_9AGAM|nr:hypothetical protein F5148DRAFT_182855 [Russula earlei]
MSASYTVHSHSDIGGVGGSTISRAASPPFTDSVIEEKVSQDDKFSGARTPRIGQVMNDQQRMDSGLTSQTIHSDPSAKIWRLYLSHAKMVDDERAQRWKTNTDGVLLFSGLFSATVAPLIAVNYQQLQPNPSDLTNQLLTQISQQLSTLQNGTSLSVSLTPADQSPFQPTASAVRVNTLWFTSLTLSLFSALCATLMQQWTQRYVQVADGPYGPSKRARIRAFFANGVEIFALPAAVEVLPVLLHASILLFSVGLVDFLLNINHIVAFSFLTLIVLGDLIYFLLTIMPLCFHNSPYQTPLTAIVWFFIEAVPLLVLCLRRRTEDVKKTIHKRQAKIWRGMRRALEETASKFTSKAEARALHWMIGVLDEDHEWEWFLDGLPELFNSRHHSAGVWGELEPFTKTVADKLFATCARTGLLPEEYRRERLTTCLRAIWCFPRTVDRHFRAIWDQWGKVTDDPWGPLSTETWGVAMSMTTDFDPLIALRAHCVQALIAVMWRNGRWQCSLPEASSLLQRQLGVFSADVERWYQNKDHLQLAVGANLLTNALPLLRKLRKREIGPDVSLKVEEVKGVLDTICGELNATDVPEDLRARFAKGSEVMAVFFRQDVPRGSIQRTTIDASGPWTKILSPVEIEREDHENITHPNIRPRSLWDSFGEFEHG